jgi:hypothetical protein
MTARNLGGAWSAHGSLGETRGLALTLDPASNVYALTASMSGDIIIHRTEAPANEWSRRLTGFIVRGTTFSVKLGTRIAFMPDGSTSILSLQSAPGGGVAFVSCPGW